MTECLSTMANAPRSPEPAAARGERPWFLAIGGLLSMAAANGIDRFIYTPILPAMAEGLGLTASQAGLIASGNYLGYLLGALFATRHGLPGSRRQWLLAALVVSAVCTAGLALASSLSSILILRAISGFAGAVAIVMAIALAVEGLAASGKAYLIPIHFAGVGIGIALSAVIVASLRFAGQDWRSMWAGGGTVSLCCAALVTCLIANQPDEPARAAVGDRPAISPRFRMLIAAYTMGAFGYVVTATFIVALVRGSAVLRPLETSIWLVFGLAAVPSAAVWMWLARRMNVFRTFALACLIEALGVFVSVLWLEAPGTIFASICVGGSFMGLTALGMVAARQLTVGDARRPVALMTLGFSCGQMLGPTFAGIVRDASGSFLLPSLCAVAGLVLAAGLACRAGATRKPSCTLP